MMPKGVGIPPLRLFRLLVSEPALSGAMEPLGQHLLSLGTGPDSTLTRRERELVILRTCARCGCEYEWGIHAQLHARLARLSAEEIAATTVVGANRSNWSERDQLLLDLVDDLFNVSDISTALWNRLNVFWSQSDLLVLISLVGWYHLVSFIANSARLERETWAARFPTYGDAIRTSGPTGEHV
jgi:alkylhydroperoxidase family enzyme